jgi:hypothetical protein
MQHGLIKMNLMVHQELLFMQLVLVALMMKFTLLLLMKMVLWTGTAGTVLEKFAFLSKASDGKKSDGTNNYYKDAINSRSEYIWWMDHPTAVTGTTSWGAAAAGSTFKTLTAVQTVSLSGGTDDYALTDGEKNSAFALFANAELYDVSLVMLGKASTTVAQYVISNICETRLDCIALFLQKSIKW